MHAGLCALGPAALAILDNASGEKIILLVSDITMPGMSGLDLCGCEDASPRSAGVHDFGLRDVDTVATALARGANEYSAKPVDIPKLKQDIMAVMADATGERMTSP